MTILTLWVKTWSIWSIPPTEYLCQWDLSESRVIALLKYLNCVSGYSSEFSLYATQTLPQAILVSWLTWKMNADDLIDNWLCVEGMMPENHGFPSQLFLNILGKFTHCIIFLLLRTSLCDIKWYLSQFSTYVHSCSYFKEYISIILTY